jgi:hypothetical protein
MIPAAEMISGVCLCTCLELCVLVCMLRWASQVAAGVALAEFRKRLETFGKKVEALTKEDREYERACKKEFDTALPEHIDLLMKLFRNRKKKVVAPPEPAPAMSLMAVIGARKTLRAEEMRGVEAHPDDEGADGDQTARVVPVVNHGEFVLSTADKPDECPPELFARLLQLRAVKIEKEAEVLSLNARWHCVCVWERERERQRERERESIGSV